MNDVQLKNLGAELVASTSTVPSDPTANGLHSCLSAAAHHLCAAVDAAAKDDLDGTMQRVEAAMLDVRRAMATASLELAEVLPHETCTGCGRTTTDFRRVDKTVECAVCSAEQGERESVFDDCTQPGCKAHVQITRQGVTVRVQLRGHGPEAAGQALLLTPEDARRVCHALASTAHAVEHDVELPRQLPTLVEIRPEDEGRTICMRFTGPMPAQFVFPTEGAGKLAEALQGCVAKALRMQVMQ